MSVALIGLMILLAPLAVFGGVKMIKEVYDDTMLQRDLKRNPNPTRWEKYFEPNVIHMG